jgi:tetratricopeptide (TPR) repeat protein
VLNPTYAAGKLPYNLGYLCGKQGFLGLARHYYELALPADSENWRAAENLSFILLLDSESDKAEEYWLRCRSMKEKSVAEQLSSEEVEVIENHTVMKQAKWDLLKNFALETQIRNPRLHPAERSFSATGS